jgi:hypothetical protein
MSWNSLASQCQPTLAEATSIDAKLNGASPDRAVAVARHGRTPPLKFNSGRVIA